MMLTHRGLSALTLLLSSYPPVVDLYVNSYLLQEEASLKTDGGQLIYGYNRMLQRNILLPCFLVEE
jgi:hypothetical protein